MGTRRVETLEVEEATLSFDSHAPEPEPIPAPVVTLPEPMLRYRCNERGCCCSGWRIPFRTEDLVRLGRHLDAGDRARLSRDLEMKVELGPEGERVVKEVYPTDDDGTCRFLAPQGSCEIHAKYGLNALANICVDFPVSTYDAHEGVDFYFDPVCPSVLDALGADDAPLAVTSVRAPYAEPGFALRAAHSRGRPLVEVGRVRLSAPEVDRVRRTVVASLADHARPVWEHLLAIDAAYARLARGECTAETFEILYGDDPGPYLRFFGDCLGAHGVGTLTSVFERYRRFVHGMPIDPASGDWDALGVHLEQWGPAWERWLAPVEDALRPLHLRFLAHRHFAPFLSVKGELRFAAGSIAHTFATSLRYAAAFGAVLGREVDRDVMKAALGASEYVYRCLDIPPESLPWFGFEAA